MRSSVRLVRDWDPIHLVSVVAYAETGQSSVAEIAPSWSPVFAKTVCRRRGLRNRVVNDSFPSQSSLAPSVGHGPGHQLPDFLLIDRLIFPHFSGGMRLLSSKATVRSRLSRRRNFRLMFSSSS